MRELIDTLRRRAHVDPQRPALVWFSGYGTARSVSVGELIDAAQRFAALIDREAQRSRVVPLYMTKSISCVAAMLGAAMAGKGFALLHRKARVVQIEQWMQALEAHLLVTDGVGLAGLHAEFRTAPALGAPR